VLGGDLSVESILGKGSKFTLTLPIRWQGIMHGPESFVPRPPAEISRTQKTVLVVDDEPEVVSMIADYLSQAGYFTITATSGAQALKLAEKHRPLAITLDVIMPDMDGFEVLQRLKSSPTTRNIPTIIISISDDKETGFALGAVGYIAYSTQRKSDLSVIGHRNNNRGDIAGCRIFL
jgi:CheY-like chemotaxis protein